MCNISGRLDTGVMTTYVGLIGQGLKHSISAAFQQAAFDHLGLDVSYQLWDVDKEGLPELLGKLRQPSHLGANVTIPHKESVMPLLNKLDKQAQRIGAVNTIVNRDGKLTGYNTDVIGFMRALREDAGFDPEGKRAVLLGAGGVARAAGFGLVSSGVRELVVLNRTLERAKALARDLRRGDTKVEALLWEKSSLEEALAGCDLVVNCTSIGMKHSASEKESPVDARFIPKQALVYDVVYNPPETELIKAARKAGLRTLGGLPMLVYQGAASFELWTGKTAPLDIMFKAARVAL